MEWFQKDEARFFVEMRLLEKHHPDARVIIHKGVVMVFKKFRGGRGTYLVRIVYPRNFPKRVSDAYVVKPELKYAMHRYSDGRLCLHATEEVGPQTSGKVICDWSVEWLKAYEKWLDSDMECWPPMRR